jgi:phosphohistidine phosphatase SixA
MSYRVFRLFLPVALLLLSFSGIPKAAQAENNPWQVWQQAGVHAIMRHATAPGFGDPENFKLGQCNTQRNLNAQGLAEAKALGKQIQANGISPSRIFSSQWCRCQDTAQALNLGLVNDLPALNSFFEERGKSSEQTTALKAHIAQLAPGDKVIYVTHQVNTTALTGIYPASGEVILFRMNADQNIEVVGRIKP